MPRVFCVANLHYEACASSSCLPTKCWAGTDAASGDFPDQYQLDHIIEVEATTNGHDNGYSGWVQLDDGRIFVVNYTDDTAAAGKANPSMLGVPWIRGTWLDAEDLPPGQAEMLRSRL